MSLLNIIKFTYMTLHLLPKMPGIIGVIPGIYFVEKLSAVIDPVMLKIAHHNRQITSTSLKQ